MSDRDALLAAIRESPRDDAPRLIYADWLDEHGEPDDAEFIRIQIELESFRRLDGDLDRWRRAVIDQFLDDPTPSEIPPQWRRYAELGRRERELLKAHRWDWLGPLGSMDSDYTSLFSVTFRRGFVEEVAVATSAFLGGSELVRSSCPVLQRLTLYGPRDLVAELTGIADLNGIRELELAGWITAYDARFLASSFALQSVESLTLWIGNREDSEVIRTLASRPWEGGPSGRTSPLAAGPHLPELREVVLIQLNGGLRADDPHGRLDRQAEQLAGEFNRILGRAVARVERPWARMFPLSENVGYGLIAGRRAGRPSLIVEATEVLLSFDAAGRLIGEDAIEPMPLTDFRRGTIFVREFVSELADLTVYLFGTYEEVIEDPDRRLDGNEQEEACSSLDRYWMKDGNFVVFSSNDYHAGPEGIIHSS
jgi:uncharacterized protein (TIGR02996 family)